MEKVPGTEDLEPPKESQAASSILLGTVRWGLMLSVLTGILVSGLFLFRKSLLENYFYKKTGYECVVDSFDFDPHISRIELHNVTIYNIEPFPRVPLGVIRRALLVWEPGNTRHFPSQLQLLEIEIAELTVIREDENRFNLIEFVEAIQEAWGEKEGRTRLLIEQCDLQWDYVVAIDAEDPKKKRMELLIDYHGEHENLTRLRDLTEPPMMVVKDQIDGFFFFNYLGDSIKALFE